MSSRWRFCTDRQGRKPLALVWLAAALSASALVSITALAITWSTQTWQFDVAGQYQVSNAQKIEFVPGPPTLARLKLHTMTPYTEDANPEFAASRRSALTWVSNHLELLSTLVPRERDATAANLTALWRFNEASGSTVVDTRGSAANTKSNDGTVYDGGIVHPGPTRIPGLLSDVFGNTTSALVFDGNDSVQLSSNSDLTPVNVSVEAWVTWNDISGTQPIAFKGCPNTFSGRSPFPAYLLRKTAVNQLSFVVATGGGTRAEATSGAITVAPGLWYHVVGTFDDSANTVKIYVNGSSPSGGTVSFSSSLDYDSDPLLLGTTDCVTSIDDLCEGWFIGQMDEVAVYNTALPAATVASNYAATVARFDPRIGSYRSAVVDADGVNQIIKQWQNLTWTEGPTTGLGEELPNTLPGLQGLWHFNESSGTTASDAAGTPNNGTLTNGPVWTRGKFGGALFFDGLNDFVAAANTPVTSTTNWTLEAWVYYTGSGGSGNGAAVVYNGSPPFRGYGIWRGNDNNTNVIAVRYGNTYFSTGVPYDVNAWNHIVATRTAAPLLTVYKNGVQIGTSSSGTFTAPQATDAVSIGGVAGANGFGGLLDEVALYNAVLTSATVLAHYRQGSLNLRFQGRSGTDTTPDDGGWSSWKPAEGEPVSNLTYGLIGLWHLDGSAADDIGGPTNTVANPLTLNGGPGYASAKFGQGLSLNGSTQSASLAATPLAATDNWTLEAWVSYNGTGGVAPQGAGVVYNGTAGTDGYGIWRGDGTANNNLISVRYGNTYFSTGVPYDVNAWNHIVAVRTNSILKVYKNGVAIGSADLDGAASPSVPSGPLQIGNAFGGLVDEVAIYRAALDEHAILSHDLGYLGSNAALTASPAALSTVLGGAIPDNRYFQFRAFFSSDKLVLSPELSSVTVTAQNYALASDGPPTLINTANTPSYTLLNSFTETRGAAPSQGQVKYQLSHNGTQWYWYNATSQQWELATAGNEQIQSNAASELTAGPSGTVAKFPQQVHPGVSGALQWKAILISNGAQPVELDRLDVEYAQSSLTLTSPAPDETWLLGSTHTVTWDTIGTIADVTLAYAPDGATFQEIDPGVTKVNGANPGCAAGPGQGCYVWTLPMGLTPSSDSNPGQGTAKIKVSGADPGTESVFDTAPDAGTFTVSKLELTPTSPPQGDTWLLGSTHTLTWDRAADADPTVKVVLEYYNGTSWMAITPPGGTDNDGSFDWTLDPALFSVSSNSNPGSNVSKLRISYVAAPSEFRESSATFTVSRLDLTSPPADATWLVGTSYDIIWDTSATDGTQQVTLEYAKDGSAFVPIGTAAATAETFSWTPSAADVSSPTSNPGQPGVSRFRISYNDAPTEQQVSTNAFTVSQLELDPLPPNTTWLQGSTHAITWQTSAAATEQVMLEYSADGTFTTDTVTIAAATPNDRSFDWPIDPAVFGVSSPSSNPGTGNSRLRISYVNAPTELRPSSAFTVTKFNVTAPVLNDQWRLGKTHSILWEASATGLNQVKIEYSPDHGATWKEIPLAPSSVPFAPLSYLWDLPGTDLSFLSCDVAGTCPSTPPGGLVRLTVIDPPGLGVLTNTSANFTVTRPFVRIVEPHAGEVLGVGTVKDIMWEKEGQIGTDLKIEYSTNGFADETQTVVIVNGDNGGVSPVNSPYPWVIPDQAASPTVRIRISDNDQPEGVGVSELFKVAGSINIASPVAGLKWAVGKSHLIQWTTKGQVSDIKIELSKDGGLSFPTTIVPSVQNDIGGGSYSWTPAPADASANAVIRVSDAADYDVKKDSGAFVVTDVAITNPVGGERWLVGATKTLTWTHTGLTNARLEYSTDNGATFPYLIAASIPASDESLPWTVPDTITKDAVKIRIVDADATGEAQAEGRSNSFTIHGQLNLTAPTDTDVWNSGQPHTIQWTTPVGTVSNVKLEYSLDNFVCGPGKCGLIAASTPNDGSEVWIPNFTAGDIVKVRVSDAQDPLTASTSGFFEVPGIAMQQPAGGEVWPVGSSQTIRWTSTGSFTAVKLEYSTDDFATASLIQDNVLNTGNFVWDPVPDAISSGAKIRVTPVDDPGTPQDESTMFSISNAFSIKGVLALTAPNGSEVFDVGSGQTIAWTTIGTVPSILLQLSTNGGSSWADLQTINGALGGGTSPVANTYAWTVPDAISSQARVRVVDAVVGHPASADDSNADFTIRAAFAFTVPTSAEVWAVNQSPSTVPAIAPIQWSTQGTVNNVKLDYLDEFDTPRTIVASTANDGSFDWTVPDIVQLLGDPQVTSTRPVRIRVSDTDAGHPAAFKESEAFTVKWYRITWDVRDSNNLALLSGLNVNDQSVAPNWIVSDDSVVAPAIRYYPYGLAFNTVWSKTGYFNGSASGWAADADKTLTVFMESEIASQFTFQVKTEYAYETSTDTLKLKGWLERKGTLLGAQPADLLRLGQATIEVYDGTTLLTTLADPTPDANGAYDFTFTPSGLLAGNLYFAKAAVTWDGRAYTSGGGVNISIPKQLEAIGGSATMANDVAAIKGATVGPASSLEEVKTAVTTTLPNQVNSLRITFLAGLADVSGQVADVQTTANAIKADTQAMRPIVADMGPKVTAILSDPNAGLPAIQQQLNAVQNQAKALRTGKILNRETTVEPGESVTIFYAPADASVTPQLSIVGPAGFPPVGPFSMAGPNASGLFEFAQLFDAAAPLGEYTVVVTEPAVLNVTNGTVDNLTLKLRAPVATASDITTLLNNLSTQLSTVESNLDGHMTAIEGAMATKAQADAIYADTQALLGKWGALDARSLMTELADLSTQMGTPAQEASVQNALTQLAQLQADLTALAGTVATDADMQSALTALTTIQADMPIGGADLATVNDKLSQIQTTLETVPTGEVDLTSVTTQLTDVETTLEALQSTQPERDTLMAKLDDLQEIVASAQDSSAAVGFSQNAYAAASEAVSILQRLQAEIRANGSSPGAATLLSAFGDQMGEVSQRLSVTVIPGALDTKALATQVAEMAQRVKALSTEKGYRFDSLFELTETQATDVKTMRNRVEELKALVELQRAILEQKVNQPVMKTWFEAQ